MSRLTDDHLPLGRADVVIIGGGIVGVSAALFLADRGLRPVVLETIAVGSGQSGANLGLIRCQLRWPPELELAIASRAIWASWVERLNEDFGWIQRGHLSVTNDESVAATYDAWLSVAQRHGVPAERLDGEALRLRFPRLGRRYGAGLFTPNDAHADPRRATIAVAAAARASGALILEGCRVLQILVAGGSVHGVLCEHGIVNAPTVICAAGLGSADLLEAVGVNLPFTAAGATLAETDPLPPIGGPSVWEFDGVGYRQATDGRLVFGLGGFVDVDLRLRSITALRRDLPTLLARRRKTRIRVGTPLRQDIFSALRGRRRPLALPGEPYVNRAHVELGRRELAQMLKLRRLPRIVRVWAGYMDVTPDMRPIIDGALGIRGLILGSGLSGGGFVQGPGLGAILADLAVGETPEHDISPFALARFGQSSKGT